MDQRKIDEIMEARDRATDSARADAVERVHASKHLTARERISRLLDPGSAVEFGILKGKSADGWVHNTGGVEFFGTVDGLPVVTSSTDYSDHGGGYGAGQLNRLFALARENQWPIVLFSDGGGSRAQVLEGKRSSIQGLHGRLSGGHGMFEELAGMAGLIPSVAVVSGSSFAGHATLAACCDFVIATRGSAIGMGGPPMVEAAFGIRLRPTELGPVEMHEEVGGVDLLVENEDDAIAAARRYLAFQQPAPSGTESSTAATIRGIVPDGGPYDMHLVIDALVDEGSAFELRPNFSPTLITAFARIGGRSVGVLANQPASEHGGAMDQAAAGKAARFVQQCEAYDFPLIALVDTPGFVLRTKAGDGTAQPGISRHHARPIRAMHHRTVPLISVQIRRAYGLAAAAMTGIGSAHRMPILRLAWPTVELGVEDEYTQGFDDVIDPAETRDRIISVLKFTRPRPASDATRRYRDSW